MSKQQQQPQTHEFYLNRAIEIAQENIRDGGRPFGSVLVLDNNIIAQGVNTMHVNGDPTAHAELNAIRDVGIKQGVSVLPNCVVYASGQPCPMCLSLMYLVGIKEVYYANSNQDGEPYSLSTASILHQLSKPLPDQSININHIPLPNSLYENWFNNKQQHNNNYSSKKEYYRLYV
ncbi:hypothetical protein CYY_010333 [Polysphondylium violaceum]|uniref:CMP/dCMP-type deaminase domain-containing protein n=1 Tax=Polysphondylium violaceum TaxID=133409 RepID=A0A8J4UZV0_9MYCE|nr:hypothetical protein CYY_010333 [Polysphondylium violaceum]